MTPKLSVIVPIYNAQNYLERCLESLRQQSYADIEILLVDDGSTDNSAQLCADYVQRDGRFRYFYQHNQGVSAARNKGIDVAQGTYLGFCDSDDWIEKDMYETLVSLLEDRDADVSIVSFIEENERDNKLIMENSEIEVFDGHQAILEMHKGTLFAGHLCNKLIRRELFETVRLAEDVKVFEDMLAMWQVFLKAKKVVFQGVGKYHYVVNSQSALQMYRESFWTIRTASQRMLELMEANFPNDIQYAQRTVALANYALVEKLARSGRLTREYDMIIRTDLKKAYHQSVSQMFDKYRQKAISHYLRGRLIYLGYVSASILFQKMKSVFS